MQIFHFFVMGLKNLHKLKKLTLTNYSIFSLAIWKLYGYDIIKALFGRAFLKLAYKLSRLI